MRKYLSIICAAVLLLLTVFPVAASEKVVEARIPVEVSLPCDVVLEGEGLYETAQVENEYEFAIQYKDVGIHEYKLYQKPESGAHPEIVYDATVFAVTVFVERDQVSGGLLATVTGYAIGDAEKTEFYFVNTRVPATVPTTTQPETTTETQTAEPTFPEETTVVETTVPKTEPVPTTTYEIETEPSMPYPTTSPGLPPDTGDHSNVWLWAGLGAAALLGTGALLLVGKKRNKNEV